MNNVRINETRGSAKDVSQISGKRLCSHSPSRRIKPAYGRVLLRSAQSLPMVSPEERMARYGANKIRRVDSFFGGED